MAEGYSERISNSRSSPKIIFLICEGSQTERRYFNNYIRKGVDWRIAILDTSKSDPVGLVKRALEKIEDGTVDTDNGDSIWCIFDVDEHTNREIEKAIEFAGDKIRIILSNPSFELWYLLHFRDHKNPINNPDLLNLLRSHVPEYTKSGNFFEIFSPHRDHAISRCKEIGNMHLGKGINLKSRESNPSTNVYELVEYLLALNS